MAIPESQLETWAHQGAIKTAKKTHESIRDALNEYDAWPDGVDFDPYLQGSYKNSTNIRGDSDVDVVVQLDSTFRSDISSLSSSEQDLYHRSYSDATYGWQEFRADVLRALKDYYDPDEVQEGRKSLRVETPYLPADVVVCIQYRKYRHFHSLYDRDYVEGMTFYVPSEDRWVINYPKLHYDNGVCKHQDTGDWYKPTVRLFKNARTYLVDHEIITSDLAPSYFLECFLYNVPGDRFGKSYRDTFSGVIKWLVEHYDDWTEFICQHEQLRLFGDSPEQWSEQNAIELLKALLDLWENWGS